MSRASDLIRILLNVSYMLCLHLIYLLPCSTPLMSCWHPVCCLVLGREMNTFLCFSQRTLQTETALAKEIKQRLHRKSRWPEVAREQDRCRRVADQTSFPSLFSSLHSSTEARKFWIFICGFSWSWGGPRLRFFQWDKCGSLLGRFNQSLCFP